MNNYRWGIIGLGRIARQFAAAFPASQTLYGVAASDEARAQTFAFDLHVPHFYPDHAALLKDPAIDIVYVATTHNFHYQNVKAALEAGKHVLVEKAITLNARELSELTALAKAKDLVLMEAQTIYHMPLYAALLEFAKTHKLGALKTIQVSFGSYVPFNPEDRLLNPELAGGALLDIGVYAFSFARRFMTAPMQLVATQMRQTTTGVDGQSSFLLTNANDEQATVALNLQVKMPKAGVVAYEDGFFTIDQYPRSQRATFTAPDLTTQAITAGDTASALTYEITDMAEAVATKTNPTLAWTEDVMRLMSAARSEWGFFYPGETAPLL